MCNWNEETREVFNTVVRSLEGKKFSALDVRNQMRELTSKEIYYADVVPELWHTWRRRAPPFDTMGMYCMRNRQLPSGEWIPEWVPEPPEGA